MLADLYKALAENDQELLTERRSTRLIELMVARLEIMKSIINLQNIELNQIKLNERKVA